MLKIMKASAGSGKTYSLARTYIGLLLKNDDRYAYRHILAVTFTNKATDEMKSRILKELHVMATDPQRSDYLKDFVPSVFTSKESMQQKARMVLHDILHDYGAFAVSTIDRFFQQTLKAFSREIGQFASYQVELDKDSLVAESVDRVLDSLTEESGSLLSWLTENVLEQIEQGERYSLDANLLNMAKRLKSTQRQEAVEKAGIDEEEAYSKEKLLSIRQTCRQIIRSFRAEVKAKARRALDVLETAGVNPEESNRKFLKALYVYDELSEHDRIDRPKDTFLTKAADSDQWFAKAKAKTLKPLVYPFLEAPLEDFCALWDKDFAVYNTAVILDGQIYGLGVAGELRKSFADLMKEKNVLCIDDSNTILRDIIDGSDAPFVYEKLGVRFDHFLLDEFQDTAHVQWTNFSPLLHNSDASGGENLIVGDVKQSIYRWRGSDWKLLDKDVPEEFSGHVEDILDTNYRSLPEIVGFNNGFFTSAASWLDTMFGMEQNGPVSKIYSDVIQDVARKKEDGGSVRLTFCDKESELSAVLDAVKEAIEAGAELSDIAILVRSNAKGEEVAVSLIDNGISVMTDEALKVKKSMTVRRLVSLMSYADNPENTISSYLAESLDIELPECGTSLVDMAETFIRSLKRNTEDGFREGEAQYVYAFMDCIYEYVNSNGNNLRGFLKYWEGVDPSISSPSSGNSVKIMTIHKSKGLDFPYVIIPFAENIKLYKPGSSWCSPDLNETRLSGVADGVYDVLLSGSSESTLFADHYKEERFLQTVDNINTLYVAMTRASLGMHIIASSPSDKVVSAFEDSDLGQFSDFSQILYCYSQSLRPARVQEDVTRFDFGEIVYFPDYHKEDKTGIQVLKMSQGDCYPSIPLNLAPVDSELDVRERGRLKFSADSLDFFSDQGQTGIAASNRIKGVVLHDILSRVVVSDDLGSSVCQAVRSGQVEASQVEEITELLKTRIAEAEVRGWFPPEREKILNETAIIDTDGKEYRPDRVVRSCGKVMIIDYKFGDHNRKYERQMARYASLWRRMGYEDVRSFLWYVQTGQIKEVQA